MFNILSISLPYMPALLLPNLKEGMVTLIEKLTSGTTSGMASVADNTMKFSEAVDGQALTTIMSNFTCPLGFILLVVFFFFGAAKEASSGKELGIWDFVRPLFFLVLADYLMTNVGVIVSWLMSFSNQAGIFVEDMFAADTTTGKTIDTSTLSQDTLLALVPMLLGAVIGWLLGMVGSLALYAVTFSIKLEFLLRLAFAPVALASFADAEQWHNGERYLKKLFASALFFAGAIILIHIVCVQSAAICDGLSIDESDGENMFICFIQSIQIGLQNAVIPLAAIGGMTTMKAVVNEAINGS